VTAPPGTTSFITTRRRVTVLLFTFAAGCVDAVTYLRAHVFTANMTGNSVLLGIAIGEGHGPAAASSVVALIAFIAGVILGAILAGESGDKVKTFTAVRREVFVEAGILALFAVACVAPPTTRVVGSVIVLIVTSGIAMGMQSAAVKRLSLPGIATTYITGTITSLFSGLVHNWFVRKRGTGARAAGHPASSPSMRHSLGLQAQVFFAYTIAAVLVAIIHYRWPSVAAVLPVLAITGIGIYMLFAKPAARVATIPPRHDLST
jgi:uncharacterized membrane protein YoaK (UPF0700 family)